MIKIDYNEFYTRPAIDCMSEASPLLIDTVEQMLSTPVLDERKEQVYFKIYTRSEDTHTSVLRNFIASSYKKPIACISLRYVHDADMFFDVMQDCYLAITEQLEKMTYADASIVREVLLSVIAKTILEAVTSDSLDVSIDSISSFSVDQSDVHKLFTKATSGTHLDKREEQILEGIKLHYGKYLTMEDIEALEELGCKILKIF